ncbi:MAG: UDP-N-acetylmuramoyl-L-alanine--D-glutamate ligase [Devosiaceae bacterium]|nr:UDP-N-acetylmuramoyl-L-alanine--D-glutamate ligase [Devosiaceae bacterium]
MIALSIHGRVPTLSTTKEKPAMSINGPVLLYGAGREALSSRKFLHRIASDVTVHVCVDEGEADIPDSLQVPVASLPDAFKNGTYKTIIRSPGVSIYKPELIAAKAAKIEITTNVNLWAKFHRGNAKIIAFTGTKGKSTTAKLLFTILQSAKLDVGLAGNIGIPVLELEDHEYVVLELSSFQCADLKLAPDFIGVTSLFPEHLDWHKTEEKYFCDKLNLLHQNPPSKCAFSEQVLAHNSLSEKEKELDKTLPRLSEGFYQEIKNEVKVSRLVGQHNLHNTVLAARIAIGMEVEQKAILEGIKNFTPLPHRLEEITIGKKTFVNDSIATNPEATKAAILAYGQKKPALIIGGLDRDQNYDGLVEFLENAPLSHIWFLPDTGHRIARMLERKNPNYSCANVNSLSEIFEHLHQNPDQFDILILSPGAPSQNQFKNFEQRGQTFLNLAQKNFG